MDSTKNIRMLLIIILVCIMLLCWGGRLDAAPLRAAGGTADTEAYQLREQVAHLHQDISTINLLNGLHLTREQMAQILQLAREARQARESALDSPEIKESLRQAGAAFADLRTEIQKGAPARGTIPSQAARIEHQLIGLRDQANSQLQASYQTLEGKLRAVLSPEQIQVAQDFNPCLIPPLNLRDPVRAGQASSSEGAIKQLRRLRKLPEGVWQARQQLIIQRIVDNYSQRHYRLSDAEKQTEAARLLTLLERTRRLPEVEFEMEKDKLAQEILPQDRMKALRAEVERRAPHPHQARFSRLGRFLLGERIIPILEERLQSGPLAAVQ